MFLPNANADYNFVHGWIRLIHYSHKLDNPDIHFIHHEVAHISIGVYGDSYKVVPPSFQLGFEPRNYSSL